MLSHEQYIRVYCQLQAIAMKVMNTSDCTVTLSCTSTASLEYARNI